MRLILVVTLIAGLAGSGWQSAPAAKGLRLANVSWAEAEPLLTPQTVVVIPMASASSEHGRHLPLRTDLALADYFDIAVADGRWELRGLRTSAGAPLPILEGLCTLVVRRTGVSWLIEAYRYTMKTQGAQTPTSATKGRGN